MKDCTLNFKSIPVRVLAEGKIKPLLIATDKCFSWGVKKEQVLKLPIVLFDKSVSGELCPTESQKTFVEAFKKVADACKTHCLENGFEASDLRKMGNCLYVKKELKDNVLTPLEDFPPTLYAKIPFNRKSNKILTNF